MVLPRNTILVHEELSTPGPGRTQTVTGRPDWPGPPARSALATHSQLPVYAATNRRCIAAARKGTFGRLQRARLRASGRGYRMYLLTLRMALMRAYRWAILPRLIALPHRSRDISLNRSLIALRPSGAVP